jgi:hypothetical protein
MSLTKNIKNSFVKGIGMVLSNARKNNILIFF